MSLSLLIEQDLTWRVFVLGHKVEKQANTLLCDIPHHLDTASFVELYSILDSATVCSGCPQSRYVDMARSRGGKFLSGNNQPTALLEASPFTTIRRVDCHLLANDLKCIKCKNYESTLRTLYSRWVHKKNSSPKPVSKFTNNRYLDATQKDYKLQSLREKQSLIREKAGATNKAAKKLMERIEYPAGFEVDIVICKNDYYYASIGDQFPPGTFAGGY